jgi:tetratricopeptide (TPR) repeat protein
MPGIVYFTAAPEAELSGLDGKVTLRYGGFPVPLLEADFLALQGELSYDALGRGIYQALRTDPGCHHALRYAELLKEGYPHYVSELASHILMLGEKDVEVPYLDRRVNLLRIFALMEPDNAHFPLEIGATLLDKGCRLSALHLSTVTLYKAESYLERAFELAPQHAKVASTLAEVSFLLGKYPRAAQLWQGLLPELAPEAAQVVQARLEKIANQELPRVPAVDYLEAVAVALSLHQEGAIDEAAAIFTDIMADEQFSSEFPMPEIPYLCALCCIDLGRGRDARVLLRRALTLNPDYAEAQSALEKLKE